MKKLFAVFTILCLSATMVFAQYYYLPDLDFPGNPGGLNSDNEVPWVSTSSWTSIHAGSASTPAWTSTQSIPFSFSFNGSVVTQYKVSTSGVLTFDVSAATVPSYTNTSLPSANIPDNSICIWGLAGTGSNDNIVIKTFGSAPNRQYWVFFSSYTLGSAYSYWSIVLEESTDRIYIVDQRHSTGTSGGVTIGVQIDASTAISVAGSPSITPISGTSNNHADNVYYEFIYGTQPNFDIELASIDVSPYLLLANAPFTVTGTINNFGSATITDFDVNYSIDNGSTVTAALSSVNIPSLASYTFNHTTTWNATTTGTYNLKVWASNINGNPDQNTANDELTTDIIVGDPGPNPDIISSYLVGTETHTTIGTISDQVNTPQDLDFHPISNALWVINKGTESTGGSVIMFDDPGESNQTSEYRKDGNAWHFMSLPSAIAFSDDNINFATATAIQDANQNTPPGIFAGPTLWSSDLNVFAMPSGGNGSHLDMLHQSPNGMGIAHEADNIFWVYDGYNQNIAQYNFMDDHGAGNSDHTDGIVRRYTEVSVLRDGEIPSHLVLDKTTGWLYIADVGNDRVLRLDINSGTIGSNLNSPSESFLDHKEVVNATWEVLIDSGLTEPSGIDVIGNHLVVSDHSTGDIVIYDISGTSAIELGRIQTGQQGICGLKVGPQGYIWYVNETLNTVVRIEPENVFPRIEFSEGHNFVVYPNPTNGVLNIELHESFRGNATITVSDLLGRIVRMGSTKDSKYSVELNGVESGVYLIKIENGEQVYSKRFVLSK